MSVINEQRRYYDERWAAFEYPDPLEVARISEILGLMRGLKRCRRICDLGCGSGWIAGILGHFAPTTGVDLGDVTRARERYPNCEFISADILEWDYPRASFDLLVSSEVIEHIPYGQQAQYLKIAFDLLESGGSLILTTPNKKTMEAIPGGGRSFSNQPIEDWVDWRTLVQLLDTAGFRITHATSFSLGLGNLGMHRIVNSHKLNTALAAVGLHRLWQDFALAKGFGLHLAVLAQKQ